MDAVWNGRTDGSGDEAGAVGFADPSTGGVFFWGGTNVVRPIVTNGEFDTCLFPNHFGQSNF